MTKITRTLLVLTLILGACSTSLSSPEAVTPSSPTLTPLPQPTTNSTSQQDCGYQWAYKDLPELSDQLDQDIKNLNPESTSHATAFGENCAAPDGQIVGFAAMETDFYVTLSVSDLNDYETFGNWIAQVMQVVTSVHHDMLAGPNLGFVQFHFEMSASESIRVQVAIGQYDETTKGKTGEELFRIFYTQP